MATVAQTLRLDGELASQMLARLPDAVAYLLVLLIALRAALFVADLAGPASDDELPPSPVAAPVRNVVDVPSILRANLFGQSPAAGGGGVPTTSLSLVLTGVVAAPDEKKGLAMIGTANNNIELKAVGDSLPGGARLHAVHVDRVLIDRGGSIEALPLPEVARAAFTPPPPVNNTAATIGRVEQAIRSNPNLIGQVMHRTPVFADGKLKGIRVEPGPNAAAFAKLGLRNRDLVTSVNGVQLNDEARSRDIFDSLSTAAEARVTVERNGTPVDLVLNLAEILNEAEQIATAPPEPELAGPPPPDMSGAFPDASNPPVPPPEPDPDSAR
ncbi:MAG TPA: type II secretion system protein GspC [Steroidobacteraceae bacterium]|nr:type II secretion system protein GspC [Steroidobacteraceae bacterium]